LVERASHRGSHLVQAPAGNVFDPDRATKAPVS
jgi:hypothetical protein